MKNKQWILDEKRMYFYTTRSIKCKFCGHTIFPSKDRELCTFCGHFNYKNKQTEFKYKTKESLLKEKRKNNGNKFNGN